MCQYCNKDQEQDMGNDLCNTWHGAVSFATSTASFSDTHVHLLIGSKFLLSGLHKRYI